MRRQTRPRTPGVYIVVSKNGSRVGRPEGVAAKPSASSKKESVSRDIGGRFSLLPVTSGSDRLRLERELIDGFCAADGYGVITR